MQEQQKEKMPASAYITFIIAIIIIGVGYFWWSGKAEKEAIQEVPGEKTLTEQSVVQQESPQPLPTPAPQSLKNLMHTVTIETNKGKIVFETYDQDAPKASQNFVELAGKSFYDGVIFHRVIKGFMIQGGDPTGTGRGGPGYKFEDELNAETESYKAGYKRGVVAMANSGPDTNGSQFFIMHADYPLPNNYTIFGRVMSGMEVVDAIANSKVDGDYRPVENIVMKKVTAVRR